MHSNSTQTTYCTGSDLYSYLEPLQERVVVIISADLAHTHLASGPYGYSSDAAPFDQVGTIAICLCVHCS